MPTFDNGESAASVRTKINDAINKVDGASPITSADINGGTIDGTVIGGTTPAAISGTTGQFGTSLNVDGTVTADGLTVDGDVLLSDGGNYTDQTVKISTAAATVGNKSILAFADQRGTETAKIIGYNSAFGSGLNKAIEINVDGLTSARFYDGGDISFYEDTGTTPKFFWDASAERLGIGTSSPAESLHVVGNIRAAADSVVISTWNAAGSDRYGYMFGQSGSMTFAAEGASRPMLFSVAGSERMRITSSGNVGIGTSSPGRTLDIQTASGDADARIFAQGTGSGNDAILYLGIAGTTATTRVNFGDSDDADRGRIIYGHSTDFMSFTTAASEAMRITSSGNVAIGATSTSAKLHIQGSAPEFRVYSDTTTGGTINFVDQAWQSQIQGSGGNVVFRTGGTTERMRITSSGNVGIGTSTPGSKLSIVGLPTSSSGLSAGDIWNDGGTLKIV